MLYKSENLTIPYDLPGFIGKKLPIIKDGLDMPSELIRHHLRSMTYILCVSRLIVNEKQQRISGSVDSKSGFFSEQLVSIAFCELSNAIAPNFSQ